MTFPMAAWALAAIEPGDEEYQPVFKDGFSEP
jgi:hypothetical protein